MGLDASVFAHLNGLLHIEPFYGDGWSTDDVPAPFQIRLLRFVRVNGEWRGGVGRVETPGHRFDGLFVSFSTRHVGTFNFVDKVGDYSLFLCKDDRFGELPDWQIPATLGWGMVSAAVVG